MPALIPETKAYAILVGLAGGFLILLWWLFFSRAAWAERVGVLLVLGLAVVVTRRFLHPSLATGMMGLMPILFAFPILGLTVVIWTVTCRNASKPVRWVSLAAMVAVVCAASTLLRTSGVSGEGASDFAWRWTPTPEERLLAQSAVASRPSAPNPEAGSVPGLVPAPAEAASKPGPDWPGFRGPTRDGLVTGVSIETNWVRVPPVELWRCPVGPGWSSFAVSGDLFFTQEQRGEEELIAAYRVDTGAVVWRHRDPVRFWESNAGAGPRATPTLHRGRVYALGATGLLNALELADGQLVWSRDVAADTGVKVPAWGFSGSPLVSGDLVIVAASGRLAAYDLATGQPRWLGPERGGGYSSPHPLTIGGMTQVLLVDGNGVTSVVPTNGTVLWQHAWKGAPMLQPALTADGDLLLATSGPSGGLGIRRFSVTRGPDGWTVAERWRSIGLKGYFNDFVVHRGHAFGFDGSQLACVDLADGRRRWKGGRFGHGQLVLLADQDLLLVLTEQGGLALVAAVTEEFRELAQFPAIHGKTWNHPALAGDVLLVRNAEEMAAFRLARADR